MFSFRVLLIFTIVFLNYSYGMTHNECLEKKGMTSWDFVKDKPICKLNGEIIIIDSLSVSSDDKKINLHKSIVNFKSPVFEAFTSKFHIIVDALDNKLYRYIAWSIDKKTSEKPNIILSNGKVEYQGSGGNHSYTFTNGNYKYICKITKLAENSIPGYLEVYESEKLLLNTPFIKFNEFEYSKEVLKNTLSDDNKIKDISKEQKDKNLINTWQSNYIAVIEIILIIYLIIAYKQGIVPDGRYNAGHGPVNMIPAIIISIIIYSFFYGILWIISHIFSLDGLGSEDF